MNITLPEFALVVLIGASGSGKSTFAARHFALFETVSSDFFWGTSTAIRSLSEAEVFEVN